MSGKVLDRQDVLLKLEQAPYDAQVYVRVRINNRVEYLRVLDVDTSGQRTVIIETQDIEG